MQTQHTKTPYLANLINQVKFDYKRKKDMEANFQRSMVEEYDALCSKIINNTIELLKAGIEYTDDSKTIVIQLDEETVIDVSKSEIEKRVGKDMFRRLFSSEDGNFSQSSSTDYNSSQNCNDNGYADPNAQNQGQFNMNMGYGDVPAQMMNPMVMMPMFMNMMSAMMGNPQGMNMNGFGYKDPPRIEQNDEMIADMQKRIFMLEKERDDVVFQSEKSKENYEKDRKRLNNKIQ